MEIFNKKQKVDYKEFCHSYYDSQFFHAIVDGEDISQKILDNEYNSIVDKDTAFSVVDRNLFNKEMTAMQLELFSLAWFHYFKKIEKSILQSIFTYDYLSNKRRLDIWEIMGVYNTEIAKWPTIKANGQHMSDEITSERAIITRINHTRATNFYDWCKSNNIESSSNLTKEQDSMSKCAARAVNRIEADLLHNNEIGNRRLTSLLLFRLNWDKNHILSAGSLSHLAQQTYSMYNFPKEMLKNVSIEI